MSEREHTQFGQYQVLEVIQRSGIAMVYKGYQPSLDRAVAIKVLLRSQDRQFATRFQREAQAIGQLEHHNILPIYDYGEQDGHLYFVTQYVEHGFTLHDLLGEPMDSISALRLIARVLDGLDYAHRHGVIHRDIKPANILLPLPDWPLLADFGIAKFVDDKQSLTMPGIALGTAMYMAPEYAEGRPADARTDLYSLGVVLYHMVTGRVPFEAKTPIAVLQKHVHDPLPPPRSLMPNLPEAIDEVLGRALAKDPDERYQSAVEMAQDVQRAIAQIEQERAADQIGLFYAAGLQAFGKGEWAQAIGQLQQVQELDRHYKDSADLLAFARAARERAQAEAQQELARLNQRRASAQVSSTTILLDVPVQSASHTHHKPVTQDVGAPSSPSPARAEQPAAPRIHIPQESSQQLWPRVLSLLVIAILIGVMIFVLGRLSA